MPLGTFKLAVSSDISAISEGDAVDVRRLTISVVVDNNNDDIFLDQPLKKQIFSTIAGAVGYVRGRDNIQLTKADFLEFSDEDRKRYEKLMGMDEESSSLPLILGIIALLASIGGAFFYKKTPC